jgi:uncharacterized protein (TIGR02266 family)
MDQRAAVRVAVQTTARCRIQGIVIDGLVEDVSRSGLFLRASDSIQEGTEAELDMELPGEAPLRLAVEVVRVERGSRRGMGLRFVGQHEPSRPLANFIMRQHHAR